MSKHAKEVATAIAREQVRRGIRKLGPKPDGPTRVPFADGADLQTLIQIDCPLCRAKAVTARPYRLATDTVPEYLERCKETAIRLHAQYRPECPGDGLQISMSI